MFLMYPVLKLEICPVACKRKQIIFKRKKKNPKPKYFWCHYSILSRTGEMQNKNSSSFKFLLGIQPKRNETKKYFWIQRFVHWISLTTVYVLIDRDLPCVFLCQCCLFIQRLTSVCTEDGLSRPILLGSNVNAD